MIRSLDFSTFADNDLITIEEASVLMNKSVSTIYGWGRDKKLIPEKIGRSNVYRVGDLKAMIERKESVASNISDLRESRHRGGKARWTPRGETFEDLKNSTSTAELRRRKAEGIRKKR